MTRHTTESLWTQHFLPAWKYLLTTKVKANPQKATASGHRGSQPFSTSQKTTRARSEICNSTRHIASKAPEEKVKLIINKGIDCLANLRSPVHQNISFGPTVRESPVKDLKLCLSDKEGGFIVLDSGKYAEKANQAIAKNFIPAQEKRTTTKRAILNILENNHLESLVTKIKGTKRNELSVFFLSQDA